jgi:hypothetical protein
VSLGLRLLAACAIASLVMGGDAQASEEKTGVHWLRKCTNPEPPLQMECAIYVRAIIEYDEMRASTLGQRRSICPDRDLTLGQLREVVVRYLRDNPQELQRSFVLLAHTALQAAFPCEQPRRH